MTSPDNTDNRSRRDHDSNVNEFNRTSSRPHDQQYGEEPNLESAYGSTRYPLETDNSVTRQEHQGTGGNAFEQESSFRRNRPHTSTSRAETSTPSGRSDDELLLDVINRAFEGSGSAKGQGGERITTVVGFEKSARHQYDNNRHQHDNVLTTPQSSHITALSSDLTSLISTTPIRVLPSTALLSSDLTSPISTTPIRVLPSNTYTYAQIHHENQPDYSSDVPTLISPLIMTPPPKKKRDAQKMAIDNRNTSLPAKRSKYESFEATATASAGLKDPTSDIYVDASLSNQQKYATPSISQQRGRHSDYDFHEEYSSRQQTPSRYSDFPDQGNQHHGHYPEYHHQLPSATTSASSITGPPSRHLQYPHDNLQESSSTQRYGFHEAPPSFRYNDTSPIPYRQKQYQPYPQQQQYQYPQQQPHYQENQHQNQHNYPPQSHHHQQQYDPQFYHSIGGPTSSPSFDSQHSTSASASSSSTLHPPHMRIAVINENDVLCGRGGATNSQVGNRNFRSLVKKNQHAYLKAKKKDKPSVAASIVDIIRNMEPSGRFLKKDKMTGYWCDIGNTKAREKTSQALREGAPLIRKTTSQSLASSCSSSLSSSRGSKELASMKPPPPPNNKEKYEDLPDKQKRGRDDADQDDRAESIDSGDSSREELQPRSSKENRQHQLSPEKTPKQKGRKFLSEIEDEVSTFFKPPPSNLPQAPFGDKK